MVFTQFNRPSWITQTDIDAQEFEQAVRVALETRLPKVSTDASISQSAMNAEDHTKDELLGFNERKKILEYSVCSPCVWEQSAGPGYWPTNLVSLRNEKEVGDWEWTMRTLYEACAARTVTFETSELYKVNRAVLDRLVGKSIR